MIYCVEDESNIRDLVVYTLKASGFEAQGFEDSVDFWYAMKAQRPELIMLDVMLPGEDGLTILKRLRSSPVTADIPVIMATAKGSEYDKVIGLDGGADDYLAKPFGMMEMVSRIKAVLRRTAPKQAKVISYGGITLDESKHTVNGILRKRIKRSTFRNNISKQGMIFLNKRFLRRTHRITKEKFRFHFAIYSGFKSRCIS